MTSQRVLWTACPNGIASGGKLRVSVAVAPHLVPSGPTSTLDDFVDWLHWPATRISWRVVIGTHVLVPTVVSAAPSLALYESVFHETTPVDAYEYSSPTGRPLYTNPASALRGYFNRLYTKLATTLPEGDGWHPWSDLANDDYFGQLPVNDRELQDEIHAVVSSYPPGGGPLPSSSSTSPSNAATQTYLFLKALAPANAEASKTPPPPVPKFDFHKAYSLLQRHPALMRVFGFIVDLEVGRPSGLPATVELSVRPTWSPTIETTNVTPVTMTTSSSWLAEPYTTNPQIADGFLRLSDPGAYEVIELDVDGATIKSLNFVQAITNAHTVRRSADTPDTYGVPALRSAGLSLARVGHAGAMYQNWLNNDAFSSALGSTPPGPITLHAEDIAQGWRFDVFDAHRGEWFPLCARSALPKPPGLGGYGLGKPPTVVPVPAGDEGWIEPATTESSTSSSPSQPVYLPETLTRWGGWSLIASRPGKHLSDTSADSLEDESGNPPPADADFQLQIAYAATPGTLPTLRFGRVYRFKARVVDLAGNSVAFEKHGTFSWSSTDAVYGRLEPLASPVVVPCAPRTPGESLETLVIRSNYDIPDRSPLIVPCERHLAPPGTSEEMIEAHGVLDDSTGAPSKSAYAMLAARDGLTYKSSSVMSELGGKLDEQPLNAGNEWIYYAPSSSNPFGVPYLPDVLGLGVSLLGLPGAGSDRVLVSLGTVGDWPNRRAVRLVVHAGTRAPSLPPPTEADGEVKVYAPKASVSTVRLSSYFAPTQLGSLKLWQWLVEAGLAKPELEQLITHGGHYMFTPYREITIVHAVRQPLTAPYVHLLAPYRSAGTTYCYLNGDVRADPKSTQRVDVLSFYADPYDDGVSADGYVWLENTARVAELALEAGSSDIIPVKNMREDFGDTKHHDVYYNLLSTTRFLEYFTETDYVRLQGTTVTVLSHDGFAAGTVVVKGTGHQSSVTYTEGVDYTEDDATGSIARIASGSIANDARVEVQFVAPPVTRSSLEADARPPTKLGYYVNIPSSARPPSPPVRYAIPAFFWDEKSTHTASYSYRFGNILRVYLSRPWFATGPDELLGVVVGAPPIGQLLPTNLVPFVTGYGQDPVYAVNAVASPSVSDFPLAVHTQKGLLLEEQTGSVPMVDVAGHAVGFDKERKLWFSDIAINLGQSYFPFVKLALVRYQPSSIEGLELSRVVQLDLTQVAPDRALVLQYPTTTTVKVTVVGPGYLGTTDAGYIDAVRAYVQESRVKTSDPNLRWETVAPLDGVLLSVVSEKPSETVWEGTVKLPSARGSRPFRVLVAEFEQHKVVEVGNLESRVTYLDAVEI